jgi:hypothetical protein
MKAKLNIKKDRDGILKIKYVGLKKQKCVDPIYKKAIIEAEKRRDSYSKVDESIMNSFTI